MEWRCEWCGKPHEEDDPPCDNCGHGRFERAVVPMGPEGEGGPTVWVCTECGREHPRNTPPCSRCGNMTLEQREQTFDEEPPLEPGAPAGSPRARDAGDGATGAGPGTTTVWVCTECGRAHPRNSPPCSRCGNMTLEHREQRFGDVEPAAGGWLDAIDLKYALGFLGVFLLGGLVVGGAVGLVDLPGASTGPVPVDQVPGEAGTASGLDLATVEDEYVAELNERRAAAGRIELSRSGALDGRATWYNRRMVQAEYTDAPRPSEEELDDEFGDAEECSYEVTYSPFSVPYGSMESASLSSFDSESALAVALLDEYVAEYGADFTRVTNGFVGVDVHVGPDGDVFVTQFVC